jgi:branched-chain amino acid transport system ATP-binding protein
LKRISGKGQWMSLLELENITASYGHARVLHGVSLRLESGGATGILGANGAGKTTTLRAICGMVKTTGRIMFDGRDISGMRPEQVAKLGIAHVPEGRGTLARLSVRENLLVGSYLRRDRRAVGTDLDYCFDLFPQLASRSKSTAAALSGGEQQMLAVGRAFMAKPRLLLLDEASLGLAPSTSQDVYAAIARLRREAALSMVVVEQNAALAFTLVDDATVLETGRSVLSGSQAELMGQESIRRAYLGG